MKKTIFFMLAMMLSLNSCVLFGHGIEGSGNVISKSYDFSDLTEFDISCACDIDLIQGDKNEVVVTADDNLQEYFSVKEDGGCIVIKTKDKANLRFSKGTKVSVYFKGITKLKTACVGNVHSVGNIDSKRIDIDIASVGSTNLLVTNEYMHLVNASVGNIKIEGRSNYAEIRNSSIGGADMENLIVKRLEVENSSVGNIRVFAQDEISIENSGVGNLIYSGNPKVNKLESNSIGGVKKK